MIGSVSPSNPSWESEASKSSSPEKSSSASPEVNPVNSETLAKESSLCSRIQQAEGRNVPDLTVTEVSLFHIRELRTGEFNHKPYNLGWGHHHCNVVVKDSGIDATLEWMREVIARNHAL